MRHPAAFSDTFARLTGWLRRPGAMLPVPAATLAAYWLAGEAGLIGAALGLPLLIALGGALGHGTAPGGAPPGRQAVVAALDALLDGGPDSTRTAACLVIRPDGAAALAERLGPSLWAGVLRHGADRLTGVLRQGDLLAQADGGYAVALGPLRRAGLDGMIRLAGRLQSALDEPVVAGAQQIALTASVGICLAGRAPGPGGQAMLKAAEIAAQEALRHGPAAIRVFAPGMGTGTETAGAPPGRAMLEAALDNDGMRPHFQPQVATATGELAGFEALARWYRPGRAPIPPAGFLAAVTDAGLADRLGEAMLRHTLTALAQWDRDGLAVPTVAVNFSAAELRNPRLCERLKWELDRFDLAPARLAVEVPETVAAGPRDDVTAHNMAALARMGCGIDLADFGAGLGALASLRRFRVRRVKIGRSLITRLDRDRDRQNTVTAILAMAGQLGLDTLAEGVETPGELATLTGLGCRHVQGFAIARPMPVEEVAGWIEGHTPDAHSQRTG